MAVTKIRKGLDVPISGAIENTEVQDGPAVDRIALLPQDFPGFKPKLLVKVGDKVKVGTPLFVDRRDTEVMFASAACGEVEAINRGERRKLLSVVIKVQGDECEQVDTSFEGRDGLKSLLAKTGLWTGLRQRPYDRVAPLNGVPHALFITASDTQPLAPQPGDVIRGQEESFAKGAEALKLLTDGNCYLCSNDGDDGPFQQPGWENHEWSGPHPAGNVGTHISALDPIGNGRAAWHIGYQDVIAIGNFLRSGNWPTHRVVGIASPGSKNPGLIRLRRGAQLKAIATKFKNCDTPRIISGSVINGQAAADDNPTGFLGSYSNQVTLIRDEAPREFLGWLLPGFKRFSLTNVFPGKFLNKSFDFTTDSCGSRRAVVPIGCYEKVSPIDTEPTFLVRALACGDMEGAEKLGVLELTEEDVALWEFVCPSKMPITELLRSMLTRIEKEE